MDDVSKRRLLWGALLAWSPWVPSLIGLGNAFRGISEQKATGLGAVAGGLSEIFILWGIGGVLIGQVVAIVLLSRTFSSGHWIRSLFAVLSIGLSVLTLLLVGIFVWFYWFRGLSWFQAHAGL